MSCAHMVLQFDRGLGGREGGERARCLARVHNNQMAHQRVWSCLRFCSSWRAGGAGAALVGVAIVAGFAARTRVRVVVGYAPHLLCFPKRGSGSCLVVYELRTQGVAF